MEKEEVESSITDRQTRHTNRLFVYYITIIKLFTKIDSDPKKILQLWKCQRGFTPENEKDPRSMFVVGRNTD
jgi:hypothetical protein